MIKIAIVEDEEVSRNELKEVVERFSSETGTNFQVTCYRDAVAFLDGYQPCHDIVFMDIQMPYLNGMKAAEKLREVDPDVTLIFVTNLTQYAVKGYSVNARDYILKPVQYTRFSCMMKRVLGDKLLSPTDEFVIRSNSSLYRVRLSSIRYVEIRDHFIVYHLGDKEYSSWGTMKDLELKLSDKGFCRLDKSNIVNFKHVSYIEGDEVHLLGGEVLYISRPRKKQVKEAFSRFVGGGENHV